MSWVLWVFFLRGGSERGGSRGLELSRAEMMKLGQRAIVGMESLFDWESRSIGRAAIKVRMDEWTLDKAVSSFFRDCL